MIAPPTLSTQSEGDSDSDWDDDDDFGAKKINIKIKPAVQVTPSKISASVDELRATVGTWKSLANINLVKPNSRRHHQSTAQLNNNRTLNRPASMLAPSTMSAVIPPIDKVVTLDKAYSNVISPTYYAADKHQSPYQVLDGITSNNNLDKQILGLGEQNSNKSAQDDDYDYLYGSRTGNNFIESYGFLHPTSSSSILKPETMANSSNEFDLLPVAFAIQECLNVTLQKGNSNKSYAYVIGSIKMAVPPKIINMSSSNLGKELEVTLNSSLPYTKFRPNNEFVLGLVDLNSNQPLAASDSIRRLIVNMDSVQKYARSLYKRLPNSSYFVTPELLRYHVGSQDTQEHEDSHSSLTVNPLHASAHWLCDLNITKVRVDIQFLEANLQKLGLKSDDITGLKISMHVNGGVVSYQSKPEANWNPLNSKLTWSFANLSELVSKSTQNDVTSCLARFDLNDGPSTSSDVSLQFSIVGKTISGTRLSLNNAKGFCVAKKKYEVRTGTFRCLSPCH